MNPEAQEMLNKILHKEPSELKSHEVTFLLARRDYVGKRSRRKFASIFASLDKPAEPKKNEPRKKDAATNAIQQKLVEKAQEPPITPQVPYNQEDEDDDDVVIL